MNKSSYVFLGGGTPWVYALANSLAVEGHAVTVLSPYDMLSFFRLRPKWPECEVPATLQRKFWLFPPGYVGILAVLFEPLLRFMLARVVAKMNPSGGIPWVVSPYPWFHRAVRGIPNERLIYFNLDDYTIYKPSRKLLIQQQEAEMLCRAALTICLSQQQVESLRKKIPTERKEYISHLPLGVVEDYLNPHPNSIPSKRTVGYIGNLSERVNWSLVEKTAKLLQDVEFIFIGDWKIASDGDRKEYWKTERTAALALSNVRQVGPVRQEDVPEYYWSFGVNWIPYFVDHPFNHASCPTKIMDGLASGRPLISTDIPECSLYPQWITVVHNSDEMVKVLQKTLAAQKDTSASDRAARQVDFARSHTWQVRAATLSKWLSALK